MCKIFSAYRLSSTKWKVHSQGAASWTRRVGWVADLGTASANAGKLRGSAGGGGEDRGLYRAARQGCRALRKARIAELNRYAQIIFWRHRYRAAHPRAPDDRPVP